MADLTVNASFPAGYIYQVTEFTSNDDGSIFTVTGLSQDAPDGTPLIGDQGAPFALALQNGSGTISGGLSPADPAHSTPALFEGVYLAGDFQASPLFSFQSPDEFGLLLFSTTPLSPSDTAPVVISRADSFVVCFVAGTRILTARGEVAVERLQIGEPVATFSGQGPVLKPVRWIGRQRVVPSRHARPEHAFPVRIAAGAFAPGVPRRDLLVSPGHAIHAGGMLIPAFALLNGATVTRVEDMPSVEYVHVELDTHDILLAEGLTSESYADTGNRSFFAGGGFLAPDHVGQPVRHCFPWCEDGPEVAAVKATLLTRATEQGFSRRSDAGIHLLVDGVQVWPEAATDVACRFVVPHAAREIRLMSHAGTPSEMQPGSFDTRRLGLAVAGLDWRPAGTEEDAAALPMGDLNAADGWHSFERSREMPLGWRWTDGAALLPCRTPGELRIALAGICTGWNTPVAEPLRRSA